MCLTELSVGSVGLVVSEIRFPSGEEKRLDTNALQYLKEEALKFDMQEDEACLAAEEEDRLLELEAAASVGASPLSNKDSDNNLETCISEKNSVKSFKQRRSSAGSVGGILSGNNTTATKFFCYMCYENHDTTEDPLVLHFTSQQLLC